MNKWEIEPDEFIFYYKGYECRIIRNNMKTLCGYVKLKENIYSLEEIDYESEIYCHGGITFKGNLYNGDGVFIGFDCSHAGDLMPLMSELIPGRNSISYETYKDFSFVRNEIKKIVNQLNEANKKMRY